MSTTAATSATLDDRPEPRRGLVLGAGGILGLAWTIGALRSLEICEGWDPRTAEVIVGTSAGSVLAALVGGGVSTQALVNNWRGIPAPGDPTIEYDYDAEGGMPPRPAIRLGSAGLLWRSVLNRTDGNYLGKIAAISPLGRGSLDRLGTVVNGLVPGGRWVDHDNTWIVAMDYDTGRRVPFGRRGAPVVPLPSAVMASCAIPGWYAPVVAGGRRYVDGGGCSVTSADLLAGLGLDEVVVLAPMISFSYDSPESRIARLERRLRRSLTGHLLREADLVRRSGTAVTLLGPGSEDLEAIGANLMEPSRRKAVLETSLHTSMKAFAGQPPRLQATG